MRDIVVVPAILIAALIGFRRPVFGLFTFAFLGFFSPQSYLWSFGRNLPLSFIVAIATIAGMVVFPERKKLAFQRETVLLILLWLLFCLSTAAAIYPDRAVVQLEFMSKIFLMIIVVTILINSVERINTLIRVMAYSIGFYAFKGGLSGLVGGGDFLIYGPDMSFLSANNSIGLAFALNVPLLHYLYRLEKSYWLRRLQIAMMVLSIPAVIFTYSRGAWLGMIAALALILLKAKQKVLIVAAAGIIAVVLGSVAPLISPQRLTARYDSLVNYEKDDSAESRFWNWEFCRRVGMGRPTGGGFSFPSTENYARFYPEFLARWPGKNWTCHSIWFTVLGDHGVAGLALWIALMVSSITSLRQIRGYGTAHPELPWVLPFADAIRASLVVFMIVGTFLDAAYFDLFYYLVALIVSAKSVIQTSSSQESIPAGSAGGFPGTAQPRRAAMDHSRFF